MLSYDALVFTYSTQKELSEPVRGSLRSTCNAEQTMRASLRPTPMMGLLPGSQMASSEREINPYLTGMCNLGNLLVIVVLWHIARPLSPSLCLRAFRYDVHIRGESWKSGRNKGGCVNFIV